jgi:hypothetical protein
MRDRRVVYKVLLGRPEGRRHLEDPGVDGRIPLKLTFKNIVWQGVDWIDMDQERDKWWALVHMVMGSTKCGKFLKAEEWLV